MNPNPEPPVYYPEENNNTNIPPPPTYNAPSPGPNEHQNQEDMMRKKAYTEKQIKIRRTLSIIFCTIQIILALAFMTAYTDRGDFVWAVE